MQIKIAGLKIEWESKNQGGEPGGWIHLRAHLLKCEVREEVDRKNACIWAKWARWASEESALKGPCLRQEGLSGLSQRADSMYYNHAHQTFIAFNTKHP